MKTVEEMKGQFFTTLEDAVEIFEDEGYEVIEINEEGAIIVGVDDLEDEEIEVFFDKAADTFVIA